MPLHYVIDAYNIINHTAFIPARKKIKDPQKTLIEFIKDRKSGRKSKNQFTVVFDGYPKIAAYNLDEADINIIFSKEETADAKIKRMVEASKSPKNIVVVSDDREIGFFIRSVGASSMSVEEFVGPREERQQIKKEDLIKTELNYSQISRINQELKNIWLKKD